MGTSFAVKYHSFEQNLKTEIEDLLEEINTQVSTYIPDSDISEFNKSKIGFTLDDNSDHFLKNWKKAFEIYLDTDGSFDPTVMPLINYWGFGYKDKKARTLIDSSAVDSLIVFVGMEKITLKNGKFSKKHQYSELDFSAIAKGYAVDAISRLLDRFRVQNYMIEIGGEVFAKGLRHGTGRKWQIGINTPTELSSPTDFEMVVELSNHGMASSGNYRNYYEVNGRKYGHTIDPNSGFPSLNELLAVTVIAPDCMTADAYATGFMAMGLAKAMNNANKNEELAACFFISDSNGNIKRKYSNGFVQYTTGR